MIFDLDLFTKVQGWTKQEVSVEAESLEEAIELIKKDNCKYGDWEYLYDAEEILKYELDTKEGTTVATWK